MAKVIFDSEKELEDFIFEYIRENQCCPVTGDCVDLLLRQTNLGSYGISDLIKISFDAENEICVTVTELKKEEITIDSVVQVVRYSEGIKAFISKCFPSKMDRISVFAELIAPSIASNSDVGFLINSIDHLNVYTVHCDILTGFSSEDRSLGWYKVNEDYSSFKKVSQEIKREFIEYKKITGANVVSLKSKGGDNG